MIRAIVTDIEGTTSSINFVHEVLFPYARARLADYVRQHAQDAEVLKVLAQTAQFAGQELTLEASITQLEAWSDEDRKIAPLKNLQGLIWEYGYQAGDFHGHIYPDAVEGLQRWHAAGLALYVYSSGSVHAQRLLFAHTEYGDLTPLFSGYFDTAIGQKRDAQSYRTIAQLIETPAETILFLSDIVQELDAAHAAGMQTGWLVREGLPELSHTHLQHHNFASILP